MQNEPQVSRKDIQEEMQVTEEESGAQEEQCDGQELLRWKQQQIRSMVNGLWKGGEQIFTPVEAAGRNLISMKGKNYWSMAYDKKKCIQLGREEVKRSGFIRDDRILQK